ncbi:MAG: hypothetical protein DRO15_03725 [Thermoprotei archaeon]|nr:MAG: hypothetical protein DRO15_03725 [Thermoprotei archaeon]
MYEALIALSIVLGWLGVTIATGFYTSIKYRKKGAELWFVAGRKLGLLILWLSLGANIYSAYTFLGLPGYVIKEGAKVLAILVYGQLSYILAYLITPRIWSVAKERGYMTISDFFEDRYNSKLLGALTAIIGALFSIPYIQLQIQGVGYIIDVAGYGMLDPFISKLVAFGLIAIFTILGGMISVALINALQGALMLFAIWSIGLLVPFIHFGGISNLFNTIQNTKPELLTMTPNAVVWGVTTMIAASLGFWMWPNRMQGIFTAKSTGTVKRNSFLLSFFQISQIPVIIIGLTAAALIMIGKLALPTGPDGKPIYDYALMAVVRATFPSWIVGFIGAGAVAAAISTAAALLHTSGALFARNVYQKTFRRSADERQLMIAARIFTAIIALTALILAILSPRLIVYLLLTAYAGVTQFFPGVVLGAWTKENLRKPIVLGLIAGVVTVIITRGIMKDPLNIYGGFWGLIVNLVVVFLSRAILRKL